MLPNSRVARVTGTFSNLSGDGTGTGTGTGGYLMPAITAAPGVRAGGRNVSAAR
jgi:hypothetical protein